MKTKKHLKLMIVTLLLTALLFSGCGFSSGYIKCPLSDVALGSSLEDVIAAEGEDYTTYDSVYGGTTYTYPKTYQKADGTIKYMFDEEDELVCIAWAFNGNEDSDAMYDLYDTIHQEVEDKYGESGNATTGENNYGDRWQLDGGNIIISTMVTDSNKALQYAYLSSKVASASN